VTDWSAYRGVLRCLASADGTETLQRGEGQGMFEQMCGVGSRTLCACMEMHMGTRHGQGPPAYLVYSCCKLITACIPLSWLPSRTGTTLFFTNQLQRDHHIIMRFQVVPNCQQYSSNGPVSVPNCTSHCSCPTWYSLWACCRRVPENALLGHSANYFSPRF
jgi:hypothetical protein